MMLIRTLLQLYIYVLVIDAILSYFPDLRQHNWRRQLKRAADLACDPIRKHLPTHLPIDLSPVLVILIIQLLFFLW
jgi:YggT family protein